MLDQFIFENHLGQRFEGLPNGVYLNHSDLRNYSWDYDTINDRISRFYRKTKGRKIPLEVKCNSDEEAVAVMNRLHELAEVDIEAKIPGKIFVGDYYTIGYITASTKSNYLITKRLCTIQLTLTSDDQSWYRETAYTFRIGGAVTPEEDPGEDPGSGGVKPEGTLNVTENGSYDVAKYATVNVAVKTGAGAISATHDGNGNVTLFNVTATSDGGGNITLL